MDEYTAARIKRIEAKVDGVLGMGALAIGYFGSEKLSEELNAHYGLSKEASFWVAFVIVVATLVLAR